MTLADAILFEDAEALVIDKPAGLPVDPPRSGAASVTSRVDELRLAFARPPVAAHRLDRDTSGCLLLARNPRALKRFQTAFAERLVAKTYLAIVAGRPGGDEGLVTLPLAKRSSAQAGWRIVHDVAGQSAETRWECLAHVGNTSLLRLHPATGRTHQLRVHCATGLGCPIIGDPVYGAKDARGMMLHAAALSLARAGKGDIAARAPFPQRFAALGHRDPDV